MAGAPLVSVVMPVHNGAAFLPFALASIDRQDRNDIELVVVDDGSADDSATIAHAHPRTRCISQQQLGISQALNIGIRNANGSLFWMATTFGTRGSCCSRRHISPPTRTPSAFCAT